MGIRTGKQFIEGLKKRPRDVWVRGERVDDVTTHPPFTGAVEQLAALYDTQHDPELQDKVTYVVPETGERAGLAFMPAKSASDLRKRREAYRIWAETNFGLMGRSPDFMNVTLLAFWEARHDFAKGGQKFADNIVKYYEYIRDNDLFLSHALITPQNDRSKQSSEQASMHLRVVKETDSGIYVSGARMIATLGPVSDEMIMYNLPQFKAGDEDHALIFAVPTDIEGLRQIAREPYYVEGRESYDHPLSTRFEENDSLMIFDNVFVPWARVFCYRQVELSNQLYFETALRNQTAHQTNTRALVKMQFSVGLAIAIAKSIKADQFLHVQQMLGELIGYVEHIKSALVRSEYEAEPSDVGTVRPALEPLQALRTMLPYAYPRVVEVLQTIAAGGFVLVATGPSVLSADAMPASRPPGAWNGVSGRRRHHGSHQPRPSAERGVAGRNRHCLAPCAGSFCYRHHRDLDARCGGQALRCDGELVLVAVPRPAADPVEPDDQIVLVSDLP